MVHFLLSSILSMTWCQGQFMSPQHFSKAQAIVLISKGLFLIQVYLFRIFWLWFCTTPPQTIAAVHAGTKVEKTGC